MSVSQLGEEDFSFTQLEFTGTPLAPAQPLYITGIHSLLKALQFHQESDHLA